MMTFLTSFVAPAAAIYLANLAIAAVLISLCGLSAATLFSRQSAPVRHAILVSTLILTPLAPVLTWWACRNGWGRIAISFADDGAKRPSPTAEAAPEKDPKVASTPDAPPPDAALPALPFALHTRKNTSHENTPTATPIPTAPQASAPPPKELPANPPAAVSWRRLAIALAAWVWLLGTLIGAGRVACGFLVLRRFRRSLETPSLDHLDQAAREAAKAFPIVEAASRRLFKAAGCRFYMPPIRISSRAPAPLSLGLVHPLIVLPTHLAETGDAEQLRAILVHEMAHLVHHHHWIGLTQWLAGIMFWWNPLLHRVNRGILQLREEICDDHVLQAHADGREFACVLVDLAARLADLPRVPATLAILETGYSDFQHRITNLLDKERTIVTRMTRKAVFSIVLFGLAILLAVPLAGLRAEQKSLAAGDRKPAANGWHDPELAKGVEFSASPRPSPEAQGRATQNPQRTMRVRVLGPNGKSMPGAKVHASIWTHEPSFKVNRDYVCDAEGWTTVELPKTLYILRLWTSSRHNVPLFMHWEQEWFDAKKPLPDSIVFKFEKGNTIGGSVQNEEGKPIAGARIGVECDSPLNDQRAGVPTLRHAIVSSHLAEAREVLTDADGRWTLDNVPADKTFKITINVNHPDYVSDLVWGRMQAEQNVTSEDLRQRKATIVMRRGTVVSGKVTDPQGKPVPHAVVAWGVDPYRETGLDQTFRHEVYTDANGVYRLPPMPADGPDLRVTVMAKGWSPDVKLIWYAKRNTPLDFQLKAGKQLRLRFVDGSGKPIPGVYISISDWRGGKSLYNITHPQVLDTKIPEKADKNGMYEWTWAPDDDVEYHYYKQGYREKTEVISADGAEHEVPLSKAGAGGNDEGKVNLAKQTDQFAEPAPLENGMERLERYLYLFLELHVDSVREELHLTVQQMEQLIAPEPAWSDQATQMEATRRIYRRMQAILLPKQIDRAQEIALQIEGDSAFFDADVIKALEITKEKQTEMHAIYRETMKAAMDAVRKRYPAAHDDPRSRSNEQQQKLLEQGNAIDRTVLEKFFKLLSREQRARYEKMIGKNIDSDRVTREILDALRKPQPPPKLVPSPEALGIDPDEPLPPPADPDPKLFPRAPQVSKPIAPPEAVEAMKVLRARPPVAEKDRIEAAILVVRLCQMGQEKDYPAENAMRELIRIGKPAVPRLIEVLDQTNTDHLLRKLGFVLRGIGDPRAVPALIRAIPRLAHDTASDCGYTINNDPELLKFMQDHDNKEVFFKEFPEEREKYPGEGTMFSYGRPINEIMPALQKITGEKHQWIDLVFAQLDNSTEQNRLKRLEFQKLAARWADWWERNWRKFVKDDGEAQIEPTRRALAKTAEELANLAPQPLTEIPQGKNVDTDGGSSFPFIFSFDDPRARFRLMACIDLDTKRMPLPPPELVKNSSPGKPSPELLSWAEKEGVNLIGMKHRPQGSEKSYFAYQPLGMKVWRIDNSRYDHLITELQKATKLDLPGLWDGPISSLDEKTGQIDELHPASFLFLTKRGICGAIRVQSKENYTFPKQGTLSSQIKPAFEVQYIYRGGGSK